MKILEQILGEIKVDYEVPFFETEAEGRAYIQGKSMQANEDRKIIRSHMEDDGWTPVKEALPREYCMVWLSFTKQYNYSKKAYWDGYGFRWCNGRKIKDNPTAWRPYFTPEPYRPKED